MKTHRVSARVSADLHQLVQHFGPQGCGVRAAIILSAVQLGLDLTPYQVEVRALLSEPLREPVAEAILRVYLHLTHPAPSAPLVPVAPSAPVAQSDPHPARTRDDPLTTVGQFV